MNAFQLTWEFYCTSVAKSTFTCILLGAVRYNKNSYNKQDTNIKFVLFVTWLHASDFNPAIANKYLSSELKVIYYYRITTIVPTTKWWRTGAQDITCLCRHVIRSNCADKMIQRYYFSFEKLWMSDFFFPQNIYNVII